MFLCDDSISVRPERDVLCGSGRIVVGAAVE
jgi:hypothetical protein